MKTCARRFKSLTVLEITSRLLNVQHMVTQDAQQIHGKVLFGVATQGCNYVAAGNTVVKLSLGRRWRHARSMISDYGMHFHKYTPH